MILILEAGGKCERCVESYHPHVYDFHHRDPSMKAFGLDRSNFGRSIKALREEAKKCHLLCANCHREVHARRELEFIETTPVESGNKIGFNTNE